MFRGVPRIPGVIIHPPTVSPGPVRRLLITGVLLQAGAAVLTRAQVRLAGAAVHTAGQAAHRAGAAVPTVGQAAAQAGVAVLTVLQAGVAVHTVLQAGVAVLTAVPVVHPAGAVVLTADPAARVRAAPAVLAVLVPAGVHRVQGDNLTIEPGT
jgi:hypothetical protein